MQHIAIPSRTFPTLLVLILSACSTAAAPDGPVDGAIDSSTEDASTDSGAWPPDDDATVPDAGPPADAGRDSATGDDGGGLPDGGEVDGGMADPDGGTTTACAVPVTPGPSPGSLTIEPCTIVGDPLRARDSIDALDGLAVAPDGSIIADISDIGPVRLVDDAAPGCRLTRDASFTVPRAGYWGNVNYTEDGTLYLMTGGGGDVRVRFQGPRTGDCGPMRGHNAGKFMGVASDGVVIASSTFGPAVLFDTNTCTSSVATFGPGRVRSATRFGEDFVMVAGDRCGIDRVRPNGTVVFSSDECPGFAGDVARCGDDLCVGDGGSASFRRYAGATGASVARYEIADLFGPEAPSRVGQLASSPDGQTLVVGFEVEHPDAACSADLNILLYRVTGF